MSIGFSFCGKFWKVNQSILIRSHIRVPLTCVQDQEKKIQELSVELEDASRRCEGYLAKLVDVLKDMEEQKLKMSVKVQNVRLILRD